MHYHTPTPAYILDLARQARAARPSKALDTLIITVAMGARCCWAGSDLLVESISTPGRVYTVTPERCDCQATKPCWHMRLRALLVEQVEPLAPAQPDRTLGARLAIARLALGGL